MIYELVATHEKLATMNEEALQKAVKDITGSICVISGCIIEPMLMKITLGTVKQFLLRYYGNLSVEEIQEAFRQNSVGQNWKRVQHFNRSLNLDYIGEVLTEYLSYRNTMMPEIVQVHEKVMLMAEEQIRQIDNTVTDDDRRNLLEAAYVRYKNQPTAEFFGVQTLYGYAVQFNLIRENEYLMLIDTARARLVGRKYMQLNAISHTQRTGEKKELQELLDKLNGNKQMDASADEQVALTAKELVLRNLFTGFAGNSKQAIFATT